MAKVVEREAPFQIGFREFYRILVPGLCSVFLLISIVPDLYYWNLFTKIALCFFLGLITYSLGFSRSRFFCIFWKQIGRLENELRRACKNVSEIKYDSAAVYKYFLERHVRPNQRERIHYFTSFYYMFTDISFVLLIYGIFNLLLWLKPELLPSQMTIYSTTIIISHDFPHIKAGLSIIIHLLFIYSAYTTLQKIIGEQVILIREEFKDYAKLILSGIQLGKEAETLDPKSLLSKVVLNKTKEFIREILLDPDVEFNLNGCEVMETIDWRTGKSLTIFNVKISTNNRLMLMGAPGDYKGLYKEHLETCLNNFLKHININYRAYINIYGPSLSLYKLITLEKAVKNKILTKSSPVYRFAQRLEIPFVMIRGRHIIGPNPCLAEIVDELMKTYHSKTVLDLFSGTGIVAKVALQDGADKVTCVDLTTADQISDLLKKFGKKVLVIKKDVFKLDFKEHYDMIVADPDYEMAIDVAKRIAPKIRDKCHVFILSSGSIQDKRWNAEVRELLQNAGFRVETREKYGEVVTYCISVK